MSNGGGVLACEPNFCRLSFFFMQINKPFLRLPKSKSALFSLPMAATLCNNVSNASLLFFFLLTLLLGFSSARPAPATMAGTSFFPAPNTAFRFHHQVFSFLPKGTPIPPSAPSKRHNSVVDQIGV
ncbi:hypothetical protein SDJN03_24149, partial [Cucurbita argyrosperma subsp. sororia]